MSGYKMVPVEPTAEMVEAAQDAYMPFGDMDIALRMALLAAPAVQGELVAWVTAGNVDGQVVNGKPRRIWWENNEGVGMPIYAAPQPAEQQPAPDVAALVEALERCKFALLDTSVSCQKGAVPVCYCRQCAYDSAHTVLAAHSQRR